MSKYSDSPDLPELTIGSAAYSNKQTSYTNTSHGMGSVVQVLTGGEDIFSGVGDVVATIMTDQSQLKTETVSPMNPHMFTIPLPNEKIHCIKDGKTGQWFYTGIAAERGMVNFLMNAHNITYKANSDEPFEGDTFVALPKSVRSLHLYEGDVVVQGRFGNSLRFTASNPTATLPWVSSADSVSPITILRNGYLPEENFQTDSAGIWLTSDQFISIPLVAAFPTALQSSQNEFGAGQVILYSDRVVVGSRTSDIILSSAATIALCTQVWAHDVDVVLDTLSVLIEEVKKLSTEVKAQAMASMQQTFPVPGVGSTLLSVQAPRYTTSFNNTITIESKLMELKTNIDALKQK